MLPAGGEEVSGFAVGLSRALQAGKKAKQQRAGTIVCHLDSAAVARDLLHARNAATGPSTILYTWVVLLVTIIGIACRRPPSMGSGSSARN